MTTRLRIVAGLAIALVLAACSGSGPGAASGGTLDGKTWALTSYAVDGATQALDAAVTVDATFDSSALIVNGSSGCNIYNGPYTADGANLTFGQLATTMRACEAPQGAVESIYLAALGLVRTYTATADKLTMYGEGGTVLLEYGVAQPGTLTGVTWHATGINNGTGGVVSVAIGTDPTAIFDEAGTVSGNAGCNEYNGPAVVDGESIAIGPLVSTRMACADEAASMQEAQYVAALEAATTFIVHGSTLEVRDADGALQVSYEAG